MAMIPTLKTYKVFLKILTDFYIFLALRIIPALA